MSPKDLSVQILDFVSKPKAVLFAGAGISARVGLPTWPDLMRHLAQTCRDYGDNTSSTLIEEKTTESDYLGAATVYRISRKIPIADQYQKLASPFRKPVEESELAKLEPLIRLGFTSFVTSNYDRVLHSAYARFVKDAATPLELDDKTLRFGSTNTGFCIARIHGRAEVPESIVIDDKDYSRILQDPIYRDYLTTLLRERPCLFLGFSFLDPAIDHVLNLFEQSFSPNFPKTHLAILPEGQDTRLAERLRKVSIRLLTYDTTEGHKNLWRAVTEAFNSHLKKATPAETIRIKPEDHSNFKKYVAFGIAQMTTRRDHAPLIEGAHDAIVLAALPSAQDTGTSDAKLISEIRYTLSLSIEEAERIANTTISRLIANKHIERRFGLLFKCNERSLLYDEKLSQLATSVIDRMKVLAGYTAPKEEHTVLSELIESLFLVRAWDLAPFYAGSAIGYPPDINQTLNLLISNARYSRRLRNLEAARISMHNLLEHPDDTEESILSEIGRAAFAIQVVFANPRQSAVQKFILPQRIYLDSNILLPAIVDGHPLTRLYDAGIRRFQRAAAAQQLQCELRVLYPFVNEVVSHRRQAIEMVNRFGLDDPLKLQKYISLIGAHNGNVFVAAFASLVGRQKKRVRFADFLNRHAPYNNETELTAFLRIRNIRVIYPKVDSLPEFRSIQTLLTAGYNKNILAAYEKKDHVLVEHEAAQLALLAQEKQGSSRSVFVTADLRFANVLYSDTRLRRFSGDLLSNMSFIGLVDFFLGGNIDPSFARLIWAGGRNDDHARVREYLVQRALAEYDSALAKKMPDIVDAVATMATAERTTNQLHLSETKDIGSIEKNLQFMDRYESAFFAKMRSAVDHLEMDAQGQDHPQAKSAGRKV